LNLPIGDPVINGDKMRAYGEVDRKLYAKVHKRYEGRYNDLVRAIVNACEAEQHKAAICRGCGRIQTDEYLMSGGKYCVECECEVVKGKASNELVKLQNIMTECGITEDMTEGEIYECLDKHYDDDYMLEMAGRIGKEEKIVEEGGKLKIEVLDNDKLRERAFNETVRHQTLMAKKIYRELKRFRVAGMHE